MESKKAKTLTALILLACITIWLVPSIADMENEDKLFRSKLPISNCIFPHRQCLQDPILQRQGYAQTFVIEQQGNQPLLTVPQDKCFVLLRLYARGTECNISYPQDICWILTLDEEFFIDEAGIRECPCDLCVLREDFPDRSVVVNSGKILGVTKHDNVAKLHVTLVGYFYDVL